MMFTVNETHAQTAPPVMVAPTPVAPEDSISAPAAPVAPATVPPVATPVAATPQPTNTVTTKDPLSSLSSEVKKPTVTVPAKVNEPAGALIAERLTSNVAALVSKLEGAIAKLDVARTKIGAKTSNLDPKNPDARAALVKFDDAYTALATAKTDVVALSTIAIPTVRPQSVLPTLEKAASKARDSIRLAQKTLIESLTLINAIK